MFGLDDTIAAISTSVAEGGIGIVRMSGPEAGAILCRLFRSSASGSHDTTNSSLIPYRLHHGHVVEPSSGETVDEVLAVYMPAPRTYTRQDVVEIDGHGGTVALQRILTLCLRHGARSAEPGEFTARAFLNGRLDLAQAEAVLDIVRAKTNKSLEAALGQLAGHLSQQVRSTRAILVDALAHIEASIDFAEDEIPARDIVLDLERAGDRLAHLVSEAERGIVYRQGVRTAIVGKPNVGKSSLLNRLLRANRAIVTDIPGTTRDTLEETLNLQGVPIVLVDTAGITSTAQDLIGLYGIERSQAALAQADLALFVIDASQPLTEADRAVAELIGNKPTIVIANKIDAGLRALPAARGLVAAPCVPVSALTGAGLDKLEQAIVETVLTGQVSASTPSVTNPRHKQALERALDGVVAAFAAFRAGVSVDLVAIDLADAVQALGEITGQSASEDLLDTIFGSFCIGK